MHEGHPMFFSKRFFPFVSTANMSQFYMEHFFDSSSKQSHVSLFAHMVYRQVNNGFLFLSTISKSINGY